MKLGNTRAETPCDSASSLLSGRDDVLASVSNGWKLHNHSFAISQWNCSEYPFLTIPNEDGVDLVYILACLAEYFDRCEDDERHELPLDIKLNRCRTVLTACRIVLLLAL